LIHFYKREKLFVMLISGDGAYSPGR